MGHEDLTRAAAAAGFAMATLEDDADTVARSQFMPPKTTEDLARGGVRSLPSENLPVAVTRTAPAAASPRGLLPAVATVRDTVYGYLGRGLPA